MKIEFKNLDSNNDIYRYLDVFLTLTDSNKKKKKYRINNKRNIVERPNVEEFNLYIEIKDAYIANRIYMKRKYIGEEKVSDFKVLYGSNCVNLCSNYNDDITINILDIEHIFILNSIDSPVACEKHNIMPRYRKVWRILKKVLYVLFIIGSITIFILALIFNFTHKHYI